MESIFGAKFKINGHRTGCVRYVGGYRVLFERCFAENTLEKIEKIDWEDVTVEQMQEGEPPCILPAGYTFTVKDLRYIREYDCFEATLEAGRQCWGDVTPYQAQIAELNAAAAAQAAQLAEKDAQLAQKDGEIAAMEDAGTAARILLGEAE